MGMGARLVWSYVEMLPRLRAQAALDAVTIASVAAGNGKPEDRRRMIAAWQAQANPTEQRARITKEQAAVMLASAGIGMRIVRSAPALAAAETAAVG